MRLLFVLFLALLPLRSAGLTPHEQKMLDRAAPYIPTVLWAFEEGWPDAPMKSMIAAQIEKESLWREDAELCVPRPSCSRERGIGLGQFTITRRFNVFEEVARLHPLLKNWTPDQYRNPVRQILGVVVKDRAHFRQCSPLIDGKLNTLACAASSYNGGFGGVLADRRLCGNTAGCNPRLWFGNIEETSLKAKVPLSGYGQSFFQINRGYVRAVVLEKNKKYIPLLGS